jgi:hypothetical protein
MKTRVVKVCGDAGVKVKTRSTRYEDTDGQGVRRRWCEGVKTRTTRYEDADGQGAETLV